MDVGPPSRIPLGDPTVGRILAAIALLLIITSDGIAQRRGGLYRRQAVGTWASAEALDSGAFQFCRLVFRQSANRDGVRCPFVMMTEPSSFTC
jgi:hypothetical protein